MADDRQGRTEGHEALADELDRTAAELEKKGDEVDKDIAAARSDWESKVADPSVPGAVPPDDEEPEEPASPEKASADEDTGESAPA